MLVPELTQILATADWLGKTINYKVVAGRCGPYNLQR